MDAYSSPLRPLLRPLAIIFAVSLVIAITLPQLRFLRPVTPGSYFPVFFSGVALATVAIWNLITQASVGAMLDGHPMVHWVIEGERWQSFAARQRASATRKRLLLLLMSPLLLPPVVMTWGEVDTSFSVWLVGSLAGVFVLGSYNGTRPGQGAFAASTTRGEVLLSDSYAVVAGVLYRWGGLHRRVTAVEMDVPLGLFRVHVHASAGTRSSNMEYEIPFPKDAEDEAGRIVDTLAL